MLQKCIDINHPVKELQVSLRNYLLTIQNLPKGTVFNLSNCDKKFSNFIGPKRKSKNKNTHDYIEDFHVAFLNLNQADRDLFIQIFDQTNDVRTQFANPGTAIRNVNYPAGIKKASKALLVHLFKNTLVKYDIKDHYKKVYKEKKDSWCPFCGMEKFLHYKRLKQDYDHLLYKASYPVAAVNMYNLSPMGINCNRIYKKTDDLLKDEKGQNRTAVNPYFNTIAPRFNLKGSKMSSDPSKRTWVVNISPNTPEIKTWESVFKIIDRCKEDFLQKIDGAKQEPEFDQLVYSITQSFKTMIAKEKIRNRYVPWDMQRLKDEIEIKRDYFEVNYYHEYNYIKYASLDFLLTDECLSYRNTILKMLVA